MKIKTNFRCNDVRRILRLQANVHLLRELCCIAQVHFLILLFFLTLSPSNLVSKNTCNIKRPHIHHNLHNVALNWLKYISGWIFQKVLAEIVQKDLILSQKALISNRRNLGLFAPTSMRFPSKDSKSKDLSF